MRTQIDSPIPLFSGTNSTQTLSSLDSDVFEPLIIPNPIDALPMELIYAIDRYVTPPASPTQANNEPQGFESNSEHPSESTSSRKLEENTMVSSMTTITESGELVVSQCLVAGHSLILLV